MSPLVIDPTILLSSSDSINPLRQISRVVQTTSDTWNGVTSAGVTAEWLSEAAEAADASPTLAQPSIPVFKQSAFIPFSYEIGMDAMNFTTEVGKLLSDGLDQLSASAFTTGTGTGQPAGIVTALVASSPTVVVPTVGANLLASGDVYALQNSLPPRFQANAQWAANLSILNELRQMETTAGALKFPGLQNVPPVLLGRNANELSNADGTYGSGENYVLIYGDFSNFVIVDRWPSTLELIPNLVGANRRPTGQRGLFLWARVGSDSVVDNAFRVLNVT
jgi:HK97 family phage major capsid protein